MALSSTTYNICTITSERDLAEFLAKYGADLSRNKVSAINLNKITIISSIVFENTYSGVRYSLKYKEGGERNGFLTKSEIEDGNGLLLAVQQEQG